MRKPILHNTVQRIATADELKRPPRDENESLHASMPYADVPQFKIALRAKVAVGLHVRLALAFLVRRDRARGPSRRPNG